MYESDGKSNAFAQRFGALFLTLVLTLFAGVGLAQDDQAVIQIGDEQTITEAQFEQEFDRAVRALAARQGIPYTAETRAMFEQFRTDFLNQLATQQALLQEAEARGITVAEEEVDQQIQAAQETFGGEEQFQQALQDFGYENIEAYRESVRQGLLAQRVADEIRAGIEVTDEQVEAFYNENQELFGNATLDQVREQVRAQLVNEQLAQQLAGLQEQYAIETYPERVAVAEGAQEEGVAGGGEAEEGAADEGQTEEGADGEADDTEEAGDDAN